MRHPLRLWLLFALLPLLAFSLTACSSGDGDPTDPGDDGGDQDTTPPVLINASPEDGSWLYQIVVEQFTLSFSEAMAPESAEGNLSLSAGEITDLLWPDPSTLVIYAENLPEGSGVTLAVGTGLTDVAGNNLASAVSLTYHTIASQLALNEYTPAQGAVDVNRNTNVTLTFTEPVGVSSLTSHVTISDGGGATYPFTVGVGENGFYTLDPNSEFPADAEITVTVGEAVQGDFSGTTLGTPVVFSFTTSQALDKTPPTIESIDPASGSSFPADQRTITINFSEAVDLTNFSPPYLNGQIAWAIDKSGQKPDLSPDGTALTVYLPAELPAGLELRFTLAGYRDMFGNIQTEETDWIASVAGTVDPVAFRDGERYTATGNYEEGTLDSESPNDSGVDYRFYETVARSTSGHWELREYDWQFSVLDYYDILGFSGSGVQQLGFGENTDSGVDEFMFSSPVTIFELPFVQGNSWNGNTSVTIPGEGTLTAQFSGEVVAQVDLEVGTFEGTYVSWTGAWMVSRDVAISVGGDVVETDEGHFWIVPGIGIVRQTVREEYLDPEENYWYSTDVWRDIGLTEQ